MTEFFIILFVVMIAVDIVNRDRARGDFIELVFLFFASCATGLGLLVTLLAAMLLPGFVGSLTHNFAAASVIAGIGIYLVREALDRNEERAFERQQMREKQIGGGN